MYYSQGENQNLIVILYIITYVLDFKNTLNYFFKIIVFNITTYYIDILYKQNNASRLVIIRKTEIHKLRTHH